MADQYSYSMQFVENTAGERNVLAYLHMWGIQPPTKEKAADGTTFYTFRSYTNLAEKLAHYVSRKMVRWFKMELYSGPD
jgi:hypothetical protein